MQDIYSISIEVVFGVAIAGLSSLLAWSSISLYHFHVKRVTSSVGDQYRFRFRALTICVTIICYKKALVYIQGTYCADLSRNELD